MRKSIILVLTWVLLALPCAPLLGQVTIGLDCPGGKLANCGAPPSPEEQARLDREARLRAEKAATRRRQIEAEVAQLGAHRRAEAEHIVDQRLKAEAARSRLRAFAPQPEVSATSPKGLIVKPLESPPAPVVQSPPPARPAPEPPRTTPAPKKPLPKGRYPRARPA